MNLKYGLPGLMPATQEKQENRLSFAWGKPIRLVLFSRPATEPTYETLVMLKLQGQAGLIIKQNPSANVHVEESGGYKKYVLIIAPKKLPYGCHEITASTNVQASVRFLINVGKTLENSAEPSHVQHTDEDKIWLLNPTNGVYYTIAITGELGNESVAFVAQ